MNKQDINLLAKQYPRKERKDMREAFKELDKIEPRGIKIRDFFK